VTIVRPTPAEERPLAEGLPPAAVPMTDTEALFKEARRRRRRRRLVWALALATAGLLAGVVASTALPSAPSVHRTVPARTPSRPTVRPPENLPPTAPSQIVGWAANSTLVVISTRSGGIVRTLASDVSVFAPGLPSVSVAPSGTVYFESATPEYAAADATGGDQILSVPIGGGPVRDLGGGSDPQVSPDGRSLAFISPEPAGTAGEPPYLVPPQGIVIATVSPSGALRTVRTLEPGSSQVDQGASDLSWSPDGRTLSFDLYDGATFRTTAWTVPVSPSVSSLAAASEIALAKGLTWAGFLGARGTGAQMGIGVESAPPGGRQSIVTIDPTTGRATARLFRVPSAVCAAITVTGPDECAADFSDPVAVDASGSFVLVAGTIPYADGALTTSGATDLYVWHRGATAPLRLNGSVEVATWGPAPAPSTPHGAR
jgi:hypothetical protein